jgi:hypothetical protein
MRWSAGRGERQRRKEMKIWGGSGRGGDGTGEVEDSWKGSTSVMRGCCWCGRVVRRCEGNRAARGSVSLSPPCFLRFHQLSSTSVDPAARTLTMSYRGHSSKPSEGGGSSWELQPLSFTNTLALYASFAVNGATDAVKLQAAGQKVASDKVRRSLCALIALVFTPTRGDDASLSSR